MDWDIDFITEADFKSHVRDTILHYDNKLVPYDVEKFNANLIDPIKMVFDHAVYATDWKTIISNEIFRQRDKSSTNEIGYFHQRMFAYIRNCRVPQNGAEGGWDVIYDVPDGYEIDSGNIVHKIYVEMKNKHNTMNSAASSKTYIKMQHQLLSDDNCACFLVEAIACQSQNIVWSTTVDHSKVSHSRIRRVSLDKFYEIVTGEYDAFKQICLALPAAVDEVLSERDTNVSLPHDTVYEELLERSKQFNDMPTDLAMIMSMYMLGFATYNGFEQ